MGLFSLIKSDSNVTELLLFPICIQGVWFEQECWLLDKLIEFTEKFLTGVEVHPTLSLKTIKIKNKHLRLLIKSFCMWYAVFGEIISPKLQIITFIIQ